MTVIDIVYSCRPGNRNFSLVYSLRTVEQNYPHDRVWISGAKPTLLSPKVTRIPVPHIVGDWRHGKWLNANNQLRAVANHPDVSEDFVHFNDDFFVLHPIKEPEQYHRGPIDEVIQVYESKQSRAYLQSMKETKLALEDLGIEDILSYELHVPIILNKTKLREMFSVLDQLGIFHNKRTFYGNYFKIGGTQISDCKISSILDKWDPEGPFVSTLPATFRRGSFSRHLMGNFNTPSIYER